MRDKKMKDTISAFTCLIAITAAICAAGCLAPTTPGPREGPDFHQVTEGYDDRVIFSVIPYSDDPDTYLVDYTLQKDGNTYESRSSVIFENISASAPIVFSVPRQPGESVSLEIAVTSTGGELLHTSTTTINPVQTIQGGVPLRPVSG
ncbi:MAG: hypothetical protein KC400_08675 [Methanolinea sp.]|nr:hypothetical protein [Methanolinea sp.]